MQKLVLPVGAQYVLLRGFAFLGVTVVVDSPLGTGLPGRFLGSALLQGTLLRLLVLLRWIMLLEGGG